LNKLKIILSKSENIYENLAFEEYLVTHSREDILLFYINTDAVVIGKHQNPWKEVDLSATDDAFNAHKVARRLSGGGTVFHDLGNINFSFIRNKEADFVNFREHIEPISASLKSLGIQNTISPRNDIFVKEHKVSGNAEHVNSKLKRILHHGTLLYDSNIVKLNGSIKPKTHLNIETHAVSSVRSPVMNMRDVVNLGNTSSFLNALVEELHNHIAVSSVQQTSPTSYPEANNLLKTKYTTWEWNFGHTPQFTYTSDIGEVFKIRKGLVTESLDNSLMQITFDKLLHDQ
jgi:lipoate-protein ligase A